MQICQLSAFYFLEIRLKFVVAEMLVLGITLLVLIILPFCLTKLGFLEMVKGGE